jgi:hypothetical protein
VHRPESGDDSALLLQAPLEIFDLDQGSRDELTRDGDASAMMPTLSARIHA